jgi:hypothetical protein
MEKTKNKVELLHFKLVKSYILRQMNKVEEAQ